VSQYFWCLHPLLQWTCAQYLKLLYINLQWWCADLPSSKLVIVYLFHCKTTSELWCMPRYERVMLIEWILSMRGGLQKKPLWWTVSTRLSIDCKRGYKAHRGSLESEIRIPMYVWGKEAIGHPRMWDICNCSSSSIFIGTKVELV
jgi:hypothetical protein